MVPFKVIVSNNAQSDVAECVGFVKKVSKEEAIKLAETLYSSMSSLNMFPERNPIFEMPKSFPLVLRKHIVGGRYIILYTIEQQTVVIYRVIDSRRKFAHLI